MWLAFVLALIGFARLPPLAGLPRLPADGATATTTTAHPADVGPVIRPGHEAEVLALVADVGGDRVLAGGYVLTDVRIERTTITIDVNGDAGKGPVAGQVVLHAIGTVAAPPAHTTRHFAIQLWPRTDDPLLQAALEATVASVAAHDVSSPYAGSTFLSSLPARMPAAEVASSTSDASADAPTRDEGWSPLLPILAVLLGAWGLACAVRGPVAPLVVRGVHVKRTHVLPAVLQSLIFAYWSLYYPEVRAHVSRLVVQIAFAYLFDFLLAWTQRKPWQLGLAVVPVVLSANLFVWFDGSDAYLYFVVIALALASKAFVTRRSGERRHVFNPSAFGTSVVGLACILAPRTFHYAGISHEIALPPNMAEVIFLLSLVPFVLLRTALIPLAAFVTMSFAHQHLGAAALPVPWWPAWLLAITLFASDPATTPKSAVGRLLFGAFVGVGITLVSLVLLRTIGTDYFAKVLPIPIANLLVPAFDAAAIRARRVSGWIERVTAGRFAVVGLWVLVFVLGIAREKASGFDASTKAAYHTRFVVRHGDAPPSCADNPTFCQPFSFGRELAAWRGVKSGSS